MNIMFERIQSEASEYLLPLQELYESAFPAAERRDFKQLVAMLQEPVMHLHVALKQKQLAGFFIFWELPNILFLEHLAVVPQQRGLGLGTQIVQWLLDRAAGNPLLLEVERPVTDIASKRILYYQRLGLTLYPDYDYLQPAYSRYGSPVPLYLMSAPPLPSEADLVSRAEQIRTFVYEQFYT